MYDRNMAKNLFEVVQALFIPFVFLGIVSAQSIRTNSEKMRTWFWRGLCGMFFVVVLVSFLRHHRFIKYNQINNIYLLCASFIFGLVYIVFSWLFNGKWNEKTKSIFVIKIIYTVAGVLYVACLMLFKVPVIYELPFHFVGMYDTYFSTMFLFKCTGYLLGLLACYFACLAVYKILTSSSEKVNALSFTAMYLAGGFIYFVNIIGIINSYYRRKIKIPNGLRKKLPELIQAENVVFFIAIFLLLIIAVLFFAYYTKIHGEYENSAEHRKLKAFSRNNRRWAFFALCVGIFVFIDMTSIKKLANKVVELSPSEDFEIEGNRIFIPLEQVSDGHLHRFTWTNEAGKGIRFIIVQKQGSSFGVGFDACDVCGDVGYYERKDEIVCNRCDVVMNKSTIGLKGGCNPVPLYSFIEDGGIVIMTDDLEKEAHRFKN